MGITLAVTGPLFAQSIDDFDPRHGEIGQSVAITGRGFNTEPSAFTVRFNGVKATDYYIVSPTLVHATVPAGATNGYITVQNTGGPTVYSPLPFTVIGPGPYISSLETVSGGPGAQVGINGAHFTTGVTNVSFNGAKAPNYYVVSDTYMWAVVPTNATSGRITVSSYSGSSTSAQIFYLPPILTSFTPAEGKVGTTVQISGTNFTGALSVRFNGVPATSFTVNSDRLITTQAPTNVSTGLILVTTPGGPVESTNKFKVIPTIFGFVPNAGAVGTSVTISGANFNVGKPEVRFNGVKAADPTGVSFDQLTAVVPAGASTGPITITTGDGSDTSVGSFFLPLSVTNITPNSGVPGKTVMVKGLNLTGAIGVRFNGTPAQYFVTNNTTLGAVVPAGVTTGPIEVFTPAYSAASSQFFYGPPTVESFTPLHAPPGTNVTIRGTNLLVATAVRFNGVAAAFTTNANNQITAVVPGSAASGPITVETPSGTNTSSASFTVDRPSDLTLWGNVDRNPVTKGSNLVYTITLVNNGPYDAEGVRFTNYLDPSVTFKSATLTQGTFTTEDGTLVGEIGKIIRTGTATCKLTVVPNRAGAITNFMTIGGANADLVPGNNQAEVSSLVESPVILSIRLLSTNEVRISWPVDLTNYVLQHKLAPVSELLGTNLYWSNVTTAPVVSGSTRSVVEAPAESQRYYRLKK